MMDARYGTAVRRVLVGAGVACMLVVNAAAAKPEDPGKPPEHGKPDHDAIACRRAIADASASYFRRKATVLQRCEQRKVVGRLDPSTECTTERRTSRLITRLGRLLEAAIAASCGGEDLTCGTSDDPALSDSGWDVGSCPNFENGACTNAIADCGDVATCLACVDEAAADQAARLYYGALDTSEFGTGSTVNVCQATIGRATTTFLRDKSEALADCRRLQLGPGNPQCEQRAARAIAAAEARKVDAICAACGGPDGACGGGDDLTPAEIGFVASCPDVTPPGGTSCAGPVGDLEALVACVDCVTEFKVDCVDRLSVPTLADYPPECNAGGSTTTTPTSTTSTTTTPPTCGNGVLDTGEECDASSPSGALVCPAGEQCTPGCTCEPVATTTTPATSTSTTSAPSTTSTSTTTTTTPADCGNGVVDAGEECDFSSPSGALLCGPGEECTLACTCAPVASTTTPTSSTTTTTTIPPTCGNGILDSGEECDASSPSGTFVCPAGEACTPGCTCEPVATTTTPTSSSTSTSGTSATTSSSTTTTTTPPGCGNGVLDSNEECDTSSPAGTFVCPPGEQCTPGCTCEPTPTTTLPPSTSTSTTSAPPSTTTTTTSPPTCGNGVLDSGEECDTSSPAGTFVCPAGEECTPGCTCEPVATTTVPTTSTTSTSSSTSTSTTFPTTTTSSTTTTTLLGSPSGAFLCEAGEPCDRGGGRRH